MKIEELAEDLQSSANISSSPPPAADFLTQAEDPFSSQSPQLQNDTTTPSLPPGLASLHNKSGMEMLDDLNKSPLFMTNLEENDDLEALKALAYEGTPLEVAAGFKERGNESFQERGWVDAKEFYGKGIQVLIAEVRRRQKGAKKENGEGDVEQEVQGEIKVLEACLVNRAACHLELKNYRSCTLDCASALRINARNVKAFYRSAKALLALDRVKEADDACARGLEIDAENQALLGVAKQIITRYEVLEERRKREMEREMRNRKVELTLRAALKARSITTRKTNQPPEMEDAKIQLVPDPVDPTSTLSFPAVLLYPLHLESDFIKAFNELETLGSHFEYILPVPWDREGVYTLAGVECYMETTKGGLVKVGKKVPLLKVLSSGSIEVVDEVVKIFVVPIKRAGEWTAEFKRKKAAEVTG
ncbi:hypothetical protein B7494_g1648 [Chlorociboria aeruginascens]|nr:hypothetical protein B7494_g1648 [Chlorociboria aeruginascens]